MRATFWMKLSAGLRCIHRGSVAKVTILGPTTDVSAINIAVPIASKRGQEAWLIEFDVSHIGHMLQSPPVSLTFATSASYAHLQLKRIHLFTFRYRPCLPHQCTDGHLTSISLLSPLLSARLFPNRTDSSACIGACRATSSRTSALGCLLPSRVNAAVLALPRQRCYVFREVDKSPIITTLQYLHNSSVLA